MSSIPTDNPLVSLSHNLAEIVERVGRSIVTVNARRIPSSGIHWRSGIIITSDETIRREDDITVTLPDGRTVPVTFVGRDPTTDVAALKLPDAELPVVAMPTGKASANADANDLKVGHLVLAIGRGREKELAASMGIVGIAGASWRSMSGGTIDRFLALDLTLHPGCAGGAIANAAGEVVGFSTMGPRGVVLTIPSTTVNRVIDQLQAKGRISRGYLGVGMQPVRLPDSLKDKLFLASDRGVILVSIEPQGPADRAGILLGDILVALNNTPVGNTNDVQSFLGSQSVGQTLSAKIVRGGELVEIAIAVGER
jgi:S1-C subfamily serine protease